MKVLFFYSIIILCLTNFSIQAATDDSNFNGKDCEAYFHIINTNTPNCFGFADESVADSIVKWTWDMGDGTIVYEQNVVYTFQLEGNYRVCLTIETFDGCTDSFCDTVYAPYDITDTSCYADFNYYVIEDGDGSYQFIDNSSDGIMTWYWDFGDGDISTEQNPRHAFAKNDMYSVCLTVADSNYCVETYCRQDYFYSINDSLKCEAGFVTEVQDDTDCYCIKFYDNSQGLVTNWRWNFGDGTISYNKNPMKEYSSEGIYNVCITITTLQNCESSFCKPVWVFNEDEPEIEAAFYTNTTDINNIYEFTDASTGNISSWEWSFGDGHQSSEQNPFHEYLEEGLYCVCLKIINNAGKIDTYCKSVLIDNSSRSDTVLYELSGNITADVYTLPYGVIILFEEISDNSLLANQITTIEEGAYSFMVNPGNYRLYAIPYLDVQWDYVFPVYMPSYYGNSLHWGESNILNVNETLQDIEISILSSEIMNFGDGYISGNVAYSDEVLYMDSIYNLDWFEIGMIAGSSYYSASNITVILIDDQDMLIDYTLTNTNGEYEFEEIDFGTYYMYTEKAGMLENLTTVTINEENDSIRNVDFILYPSFQTSIFPDNFELAGNAVIAYPNPFSDILNISSLNFENDKIAIELIALSGSIIKKEEYINIHKSDVISISTSDLEQGIYFVRIIDEHEIRTMKVIK